MSDYSVCTQCGAEIEESGIQFRGHMFCSDECCEEYELEFQEKDEPEIEDFDPDDEDIEDFDDDLGYSDKDDFDGDNMDDDDFDIRPEDF